MERLGKYGAKDSIYLQSGSLKLSLGSMATAVGCGASLAFAICGSCCRGDAVDGLLQGSGLGFRGFRV